MAWAGKTAFVGNVRHCAVPVLKHFSGAFETGFANHSKDSIAKNRSENGIEMGSIQTNKAGKLLQSWRVCKIPHENITGGVSNTYILWLCTMQLDDIGFHKIQLQVKKFNLLVFHEYISHGIVGGITNDMLHDNLDRQRELATFQKTRFTMALYNPFQL